MRDINLLNEIKKAIKSSVLVIVEGKKDKVALEKIGFESKNILLIHGKPFYKTIDEVEKRKTKKCIILTDLDKKGKQFYYILKKILVRKGIKIEDKLRKIMLKERISHTEGLATFIQKRLTNL